MKKAAIKNLLLGCLIILASSQSQAEEPIPLGFTPRSVAILQDGVFIPAFSTEVTIGAPYDPAVEHCEVETTAVNYDRSFTPTKEYVVTQIDAYHFYAPYNDYFGSGGSTSGVRISFKDPNVSSIWCKNNKSNDLVYGAEVMKALKRNGISLVVVPSIE